MSNSGEGEWTTIKNKKTTRNGRKITSAMRDSIGCTVRKCRNEAADDKKVKCAVSSCHR